VFKKYFASFVLSLCTTDKKLTYHFVIVYLYT